MKMTKDQCPECGAYSTARYSDGTYECLSCRHITFDPYVVLPSKYDTWPERANGRVRAGATKHREPRLR